MGEMTLKEAKILKLKSVSAGVLLAFSLPSHALTLGKFQSLSGMGEPLLAEVEVTQFTADELRGLKAQLGTPSSFRQAGMEYNPALKDMAVRIENRNDGRPFIVLNGRTPVQDSFIDLILEAQWPTGRAVKNYALLLNSAKSNADSRPSSLPAPQRIQPEVISSPVTLARAALPAASPVSSDGKLSPSSMEVSANQVPVYHFDNVAGTPPASPATVAVTATPSAAYTRVPGNTSVWAGGETITVNHGDTASNLTMDRIPANVSSDQMLLALVRANPNAFIEGNVNLVRAGTVLRIPKADEALQISRSEARQTVMAQNRDFAAYARRVAESPLLVGSAQSREMSGTVTKESPNTLASSTKQDKLTLSKAQVGNNSAEAKLAAEREAKDTADQLGALNKNMQDLEALAKDRKTDSAPTVSSNLPDPSNNDTPLLEDQSQNKSVWAWTIGALLALVALVLWSRKKSTKSNELFAPSYDDIPQPSVPAATSIPPQMSGIDLNLDNTPGHQAEAPASNAATEQNKLTLASQLLASGDKDLARSLIMSVASTASGDLRSRAQHMLGQIA